VDVLERKVDPDTLIVHTVRLILKRGSLPRWFPRGIVTRAESWVLEDSIVDATGLTLHSRTRNLDHRRILDVLEHQRLSPSGPGNIATAAFTHVRIESFLGTEKLGSRMLRHQIENFGLASFKRNVERSRFGMAQIIDLLESNERPLLLSGNYTFRSRIAEALSHWRETDSGLSRNVSVDSNATLQAQYGVEEHVRPQSFWWKRRVGVQSDSCRWRWPWISWRSRSTEARSANDDEV